MFKSGGDYEEKLEQARKNNDFSNIKCLEKDLSFFGSGAILHEMFFENMGPAIPTEPNAELYVGTFLLSSI